MKTFDEHNFDSLNEHVADAYAAAICLGKVSATVVIARLLGQVNKLKDRQLGQVLRTLGVLIYITSLQHKSKKKEELNSNRNKEFKRKRIKTW